MAQLHLHLLPLHLDDVRLGPDLLCSLFQLPRPGPKERYILSSRCTEQVRGSLNAHSRLTCPNKAHVHPPEEGRSWVLRRATGWRSRKHREEDEGEEESLC